MNSKAVAGIVFFLVGILLIIFSPISKNGHLQLDADDPIHWLLLLTIVVCLGWPLAYFINALFRRGRDL